MTLISCIMLGRVTKQIVGRLCCMTIEALRDARRISSASPHRAEPAMRSDHPVQVSVQLGPENLQGWSLHNFLEQPEI